MPFLSPSRVRHSIFPFLIFRQGEAASVIVFFLFIFRTISVVLEQKKIEQKKDPPQEPNLVKYSTGCAVEERMAYVKLEGFHFVQKKDYLPIKREID